MQFNKLQKLTTIVWKTKIYLTKKKLEVSFVYFNREVESHRFNLSIGGNSRLL